MTLVSMGAAKHGASASMGVMGSTQICATFVLPASFELVWLGVTSLRDDNRQKFSRYA